MSPNTKGLKKSKVKHYKQDIYKSVYTESSMNSLVINTSTNLNFSCYLTKYNQAKTKSEKILFI